MKECDKRKSHISNKLHMIYISSNNIRLPVTKTFTPLPALHSTSLHLSTLHFLLSKLHQTTLHYPLIWLNPIYIPNRSISPHFTTLHLTSLHSTFRWISPHFYSFHFIPFIITFLTLFLKTLCLPIGIFPSGFSTETLYAFLFSLKRATSLANFIFLCLIIFITSD